MEFIFIRHGATFGNLMKRFIGITDEELCEEGIDGLYGGSLISDDRVVDITTVYTSPLKRCTKTAEILFPGAQQIICDEIRECDFGILEGKNHEELLSDERYIRFIENERADEFPCGERIADFLLRCAQGFRDIVEDATRRGLDKIVVVAHGGTAMGILDTYLIEDEKKGDPYYKWSPENGHGYHASLSYDDNEIVIYDLTGI